MIEGQWGNLTTDDVKAVEKLLVDAQQRSTAQERRRWDIVLGSFDQVNKRTRHPLIGAPLLCRQRTPAGSY